MGWVIGYLEVPGVPEGGFFLSDCVVGIAAEPTYKLQRKLHHPLAVEPDVLEAVTLNVRCEPPEPGYIYTMTLAPGTRQAIDNHPGLREALQAMLDA